MESCTDSIWLGFLNANAEAGISRRIRKVRLAAARAGRQQDVEVLEHLERDEHARSGDAAHALGILIGDRDDTQFLFALKDRKHTAVAALADRRCRLRGSWRGRGGCRGRALCIAQSQFLSNQRLRLAIQPGARFAVPRTYAQEFVRELDLQDGLVGCI